MKEIHSNVKDTFNEMSSSMTRVNRNSTSGLQPPYEIHAEVRKRSAFNSRQSRKQLNLTNSYQLDTHGSAGLSHNQSAANFPHTTTSGQLVSESA